MKQVLGGNKIEGQVVLTNTGIIIVGIEFINKNNIDVIEEEN
jgi:hypothetical protein